MECLPLACGWAAPSHRHGEAHTGITADLGEFLHDKIRAQWQLPKSMVRIARDVHTVLKSLL